MHRFPPAGLDSLLPDTATRGCAGTVQNIWRRYGDSSHQYYGHVPCQNSLITADLPLRARYAALRYSLISPPTTLLRLIWEVISATRPGRCSGASCIRPWCGYLGCQELPPGW